MSKIYIFWIYIYFKIVICPLKNISLRCTMGNVYLSYICNFILVKEKKNECTTVRMFVFLESFYFLINTFIQGIYAWNWSKMTMKTFTLLFQKKLLTNLFFPYIFSKVITICIRLNCSSNSMALAPPRSLVQTDHHMIWCSCFE